MKMREALMKVYGILSQDEKLLRLLYYHPKNYADNPLSEEKDNVTEMADYYDFVDDAIIPSPTADGLVDEEPKSRITIYPDDRNSRGGYRYAPQTMIIDVFTHHSINKVDFRNSWICDHIMDLLSEEYVEDIGTLHFSRGHMLGAPKGYFAYRLQITFGDFN